MPRRRRTEFRTYSDRVDRREETAKPEQRQRHPTISSGQLISGQPQQVVVKQGLGYYILGTRVPRPLPRVRPILGPA